MSADACVCADAARVGARTLVLRPGGETRRDAGRAGGAVGALRSIDASDAVVAPQRRSVGYRSDIVFFSYHFEGRRPAGGDDDDDLEAESQDRRSGCR